LLVEAQPDGEPQPSLAAVIGQRVRGAGAVGTDHDLGLRGDLSRQRLESLVEHGDVIGGGVRAGVARAQHGRQRQPAGRPVGQVEVGQQRMKPEPALVGARRPVLVAVGADQRGVDVDDQRPAGPTTKLPGPLARDRPRRSNLVEQAVLGDRVNDPPRGRV